MGRPAIRTLLAGFFIIPQERHPDTCAAVPPRPDDTEAPSKVVVVLNWFEELKAKVGN